MPTKKDISALLDAANDLVDDEKTRAMGLAELREIVADEPRRVDAAYYLAWALLTYESTAPTSAEVAEAEVLRARIVENTRGLVPSDAEPSVEMRARAFALAWPIPDLCVKATESELTELARRADEAQALRKSIFTDAAMRAVRLGTTWAAARSRGKPEAGFEALFEWVKAHPLHSSWRDTSGLKDGNEAGSPPSSCITCVGYEPFFEDPGYLEWVAGRRSDDGNGKRSSKPSHPVPLLVQSLCAAAGADIKEHRGFGSAKTIGAGRGRPGRILSLVALGANLEGGVVGPTVGTDNPLAWAARFAGPSLVRFLIDHGAPINGKNGDVPLISTVMYGGLEPTRILLEAGADPNVEVTYRGGMKDSPIKRAGKNKEMLALLRGGKAAREPKKKTGGVDTGPARTAWEERKKAIRKAKWADGDEDLTTFFDLVDEEGSKAWEAAATHLESLNPTELLALALILDGLSLPAQKKPVEITKKDHQKPRLVIGDAIVKGDALLGTGTEWVVTGNLHLEGRFAHDEAARIAVGGNVTGTMVETEGELLIGGDLTIDEVVWAEYEAGTLVVAGTLETNVLIEKNHEVSIGKVSAPHRLKDTTVKAAGKLFPEVAFKDGRLDGKRLWATLAGSIKSATRSKKK